MSRENRSKYAILGFLDLCPMSGYDIRKYSAFSLSHFWNEDYSHIYPTLRALVDEGLAIKDRGVAQGRRERDVYTITEAGRQELAVWLRADPLRPNFRIELLLKVFFGARLGAARLSEMLEAEAASCESALREFEATETHLMEEIEAGGERAVEARYQLLSLRYGQRSYGAVKEWCRESIATLGAAE
jgi:DNA-binding PadR family transcriptional regulator